MIYMALELIILSFSSHPGTRCQSERFDQFRKACSIQPKFPPRWRLFVLIDTHDYQ